ncbi:hypothetical protein SPRG_10786 [Saprolegnia parasitica CBS 223.65]|uniref:Uncharacterized protein n=1 Tax=Saprolegnia parasitica (strain CBS 223.65) TaxID=695850 RepID=A0A067CAM2_SAPPC|nr:hypothetical protein SPRG_10786 [Saprolegnia parasitica CBS 223.65]KDO23591.1 hypothetical protein SPRG_10786 [Saprolegnia parasitica CBS 223.65]|eukprot:XP_012205739.1 hypothetical protein SPRG_10786 [Saprolegnia parasitica CBS 223.65]
MFVGTASCAQAIDGFEHSCGMSLRGYKAKGHFTPKPAGLHLDATKSAFGAMVAIDPAFVPPQTTRTKKEKTLSRASSSQSRDPARTTYRPQSAARARAAPVDFVYDMDTRKELRQALDKERKELLQQAQERERKLRDANLWLHDRRNEQGPVKAKSQPRKTTRSKPTSKECWTSSSCDDLLRTVHVAVEIKDDADDEITWTSSSAPATSKTKTKHGRPLTAKGPRNSVAENVHRSAPQTQAYHRGS